MSRRSLFVASFILVVGSSCGARTTLQSDGGGGGSGPANGGNGTGAAGLGGFGGFGDGGVPVPGGGGSGGSGPRSTIISEAPNSEYEGETDVKAASNGFVSAAWIGVDLGAGKSFIGYAFSTDNGDTWAEPQVAETPGGKQASDPVLALDASGGFWLTWVSFDYDDVGNLMNMVVEVAHADPGSTVFQPAVDAGLGDTFDVRDKPWIAITPEGLIIVTYAEFTNTALDIIAVTSQDGFNWQRNVVMHDEGFVGRNLAYPCASPGGGRIYAVWIATDGVNNWVESTHSDDFGVSWTHPATASAGGELVAFSDPTCNVDPATGELFVSYGLSDSGKSKEEGLTPMLFDIAIARSTDGFVFNNAATIGVGGDLTMLPQLARSSDGTSLALSYYQGQFEDDDFGTFRLVTTPSLEAGFGDGERIADPLTFTPNRASEAWLGDYTGIHYNNGAVYVTYADNFSGVSHVAFARR